MELLLISTYLKEELNVISNLVHLVVSCSLRPESKKWEIVIWLLCPRQSRR